MEKNTYRQTKRGVEIATESGMVRGSKDSHYIKWLMGWIDGNGWTGASALSHAWDYAADKKPGGCSWYAYGLLMAREQERGAYLQAKRDQN